MKRIVLAALALVLAAFGLLVYEFLADSSLAGAPRTAVSIDLAIRDRAPLLARYRAFAQSHGFGLDEDPAVAPAVSMHLVRWNAGIDTFSEAYPSGPDGKRVLDPSHFEIWVRFKGWLWWTDLADADAMAAELVAITKAADPRATIAVHTIDRF